MSKSANLFIGFVLGAAAGAASAIYYLNDKYANIAEEEIQEIRDYYKDKYEPSEPDDGQDEQSSPAATGDKLVMNKIIDQHDYTAHSKINEEPAVDEEKPYIITPEEFDTIDDYELRELTFFSDHIVADDDLEIVDDLDNVIGHESLNHFGEYADDAIYVRNDKLKCDFEVLLDDRPYSEVKE